MTRFEFVLQAAACSLPFSRSLQAAGRAVTESSHAERRKTWKDREGARGRKRGKSGTALNGQGLGKKKREGEGVCPLLLRKQSMKSQLQTN